MGIHRDIIISKVELNKLDHRKLVYFSLLCVRQVDHLIVMDEGRACIRMVEKWLAGEATGEECKRAGNVTYDATVSAATYASYTAANAAWAAYVVDAAPPAAYASAYAVEAFPHNKTQILKAQWEYYYELLNADKNLEAILLDGVV